MRKKLTIRDIARLADVSKSTVSRVLNSKEDVDPATRERVLQVMREHTFVPDMAASRLAGGRSRLIGALVPSLSWPLMPEVIRGICEMVEQSPYDLILYSTIHEKMHDEAKRQEVIARILVSNLASGLLAVYPGSSTPYLTELYEQGFPIVIIDDRERPTDVPWVHTDNRIGAYKATRYLLQMGHRRIAHIQGPLEYRTVQERYQGYCDALEEAGLTPDPELIREGNFTADSGKDIANYFFRMSERPTAIFASNDQVAYDVLVAAEEYGLRIPEQLSLIGFDDIPPSSFSRPPLTTVRQPFYEMGKQATELLLAMLDSPSLWQKDRSHKDERSLASRLLDEQSNVLRIQLATDLVVRASCSPPQDSANVTPELSRSEKLEEGRPVKH